MTYLRFLLIATFCCCSNNLVQSAVFRAGAARVDITPTNFPVIVNAMFTERTATNAFDPLFTRALTLDDGKTRLCIAVVDTCMMSRELLDKAKSLARKESGIPVDRMLISATHTHSAPSAMGCLGSRADTNYAAWLPGKIAEAIIEATERLEPASVGWAVTNDWEHTHNRRWIRRPDRMLRDPFGVQNVRANMHPGYESPDAIGPSGPVEPGLSVLAIRRLTGEPLAVLANYSMHYYGSPLLSADYYGAFARLLEQRLASTNSPFLAIMSQGTSGDLMWMDYGKPRSEPGLEAYSEAIAQRVAEVFGRIQFRDSVPLSMREEKLTLRFRIPTAERLGWATGVVAKLEGRLPQSHAEIYAQEQLFLHARPKAELKLQALRIGELGITAIPNEVFAISGLKIKMQSPLQPTFNIELANGAEGYIPPPEQHKLGGYTTWAARTAGLEEQAEPKIVNTLLKMLEDVGDSPRLVLKEPRGRYPTTVLEAKPIRYWRLSDLAGPQLRDANQKRTLEAHGGIAYFLAGPENKAFSGDMINRSIHLAGGYLFPKSRISGSYTLEGWFWNGLPSNVRGTTGTLLALFRGRKPAEVLLIGGTNGPQGKLLLKSGNLTMSGDAEIPLKKWNHFALTRDQSRLKVFLNGQPYLALETETGGGTRQIYFGGNPGSESNFEGKFDELAVYDRALGADVIRQHFEAAGF